MDETKRRGRPIKGSARRTKRSLWAADDVWARAEKHAEREGLSIADVYDEAARDYLERKIEKGE